MDHFVKAIMLAWDELSPEEIKAVPERLAASLTNLFSNRYHIGELCRHGHRYKDREKSLRYNTSNGACVQCIADYGKAHPGKRSPRQTRPPDRQLDA